MHPNQLLAIPVRHRLRGELERVKAVKVFLDLVGPFEPNRAEVVRLLTDRSLEAYLDATVRYLGPDATLQERINGAVVLTGTDGRCIASLELARPGHLAAGEFVQMLTFLRDLLGVEHHAPEAEVVARVIEPEPLANPLMGCAAPGLRDLVAEGRRQPFPPF